MKYIPFILLIILSLSSCSSTKMTSVNISKTIEIDGSSEDWPELLLYDKKSKLVYGVFNDDNFVYLLLKTADRISQHKILQGLKVWYNPTFSKRKETGIHYPFLPIRLSESLRREADQEPDISVLLRSLPREAELIHDSKESREILYLDELADEMNVAIGFSNETKELLYELRIPLLQTFAEKKAKEMSFIIETSEMNKPKDGNRLNPDMNEMQGNRGRSGGMGRRGPKNSRPDFEPISLRINVQLIHQ